MSADGRTAVVRLTITPRNSGTGDAGTLTIDRIDDTTLLEEDPGAPWPRSVQISPGGDGMGGQGTVLRLPSAQRGVIRTPWPKTKWGRCSHCGCGSAGGKES